jgi:hypothetical protein
LSTLARALSRNKQQQLATELGVVIRKAARDPDALDGTLEVLPGFFRVETLTFSRDGELVQFLTHRLIPEYLRRMPSGPDCDAIRALFEYEVEGVAQSLTTRYHKASAHYPTPPANFARRHEPRLLNMCARHFLRLDREDSLDALVADVGRTGEAAHMLTTPEELSPLASVLWSQTLEERQDRLTAINEGTVPLRDQQEMLELLIQITNAAERTLHAVDQTALERWFTDRRLERYLDAQFARAKEGEVDVERLRVVRQVDLDEPRARNLLREFIRLHEDAGAKLLMCHENELRGLNTSFMRGSNSDDRTIMVMIDYETYPASLVSELDDDGYVKRSTLYLRSLAPVRWYYADLKRIIEHVAYRERSGHDLRSALARHDDPPLAETPARETPTPRGPLAPPVL